MPETTPLIKAALNLRGGAGFDVYKESALQYKCNKSYGTCNKLPSWIVIPPVFQKKSPFRLFGKDYPFSVCDCIHSCAFPTIMNSAVMQMPV